MVNNNKDKSDFKLKSKANANANAGASGSITSPLVAQGDWTKNLVQLAKTAELKYVSNL